MEKQDYIQLFDKFLLKQASPEEVQILIQWLKSEGSFQDWMDEEWDVASSGMDTDLQQKLLGQIKQKISLEMQQAPLKRNKYRTIYLCGSQTLLHGYRTCPEGSRQRCRL